MGSPRTAITRLDLSLNYAEFSLAATRLGFIGLLVCPAVSVGLQNAKYMKLAIADLLKPVKSLKRAPKANYARDDFEWEQDEFSTDDHGKEKVVDDRQIAIYGDIIKAEMVNRNAAVHDVLQDLESEIAAAIFNTTIWTGSDLTTAAGTAWSTHSSATPVTNIDGAIDKVEAGIGQSPDTIILTKKALRNWGRCTQVSTQFKFMRGNDAPVSALVQAMKDLHEVDKVFVANGFKNTAGEGQTATLSRFWDDTKVMVCKTGSPNGSLEDPEVRIGNTIMWNEEIASLPGGGDGEAGVIVEEYREESRRGGVIRARMDWQVKRQHVQCGHLITGVLS